MLNSLDICYLFDNKTKYGSVNITKNRSKNGINCMFGDGVVSTKEPTWNANCGCITFDGGDYMSLSINFDVNNILANMWSIQDETYMFIISPIFNGTYQYLIQCNSASATSRWYIRITDANVINASGSDSVGTAETLSSNSLAGLNKQSLFVCVVRTPSASKRLALYVNGIEIASGTNTSVNASNAAVIKYIGCDSNGSFPLKNTTSMKFFGYAKKAFTTTQIQSIYKYLKGNL